MIVTTATFFSGLFTLSAEIRRTIYILCFNDIQCTLNHWLLRRPFSLITPESFSLLLTCRQISWEALPVYYRCCAFSLAFGHNDLPRLIDRVPNLARYARHVTLTITPIPKVLGRFQGLHSVTLAHFNADAPTEAADAKLALTYAAVKKALISTLRWRESQDLFVAFPDIHFYINLCYSYVASSSDTRHSIKRFEYDVSDDEFYEIPIGNGAGASLVLCAPDEESSTSQEDETSDDSDEELSITSEESC